MKKILLIAFLLTLATGTAIAQSQQGLGGNGNPGKSFAGNLGNPGGSVDRLTEQLGLDEVQAAAIAAIFEESQLLRDAERERAHAVACELRETNHSLILAELTPDQVILFEELRNKREELRQAFDDMRQMHGGNSFGGGRGMQDCNN